MRSFILFITLLFSFPLLAEPYQVLVSIAPQKFLVERITGPTTQVQVLVPETMSSHSYEPTLRQIMQAKEAKVWFYIGEGFETCLYHGFKEFMTLVDSRDGLSLLQSSCTSCCPGAPDPHIWLSCPLLKKQAQQITSYFCTVMPENSDFYQKNLATLVKEIDQLDSRISILLQAHKGQSILVSHPAFGYFCHDYDLKQLAVEVSGKEPTPKQLTAVLKTAEQENVGAIFTQLQYPLRGALRIQKALNVPMHQINTYKEDVLANLAAIAEAFATHG